MSRPSVSVVMPFAGAEDAARAALQALGALRTRPGDQLILADNTGSVVAVRGAGAGGADLAGISERVEVVRASGERSPAHARNRGAAQARADWILFLDADCVAPPGLLDAYFAAPVDERTGALAGEVIPLPTGSAPDTLAARYGAARRFLSAQAHLRHPYLPRAVAANLLVRRQAFEALGGFFEGLRAAEDTDFSWRLQRAGWRLELRPEASVAHRYRTTVGELRAQWRGYAAGRAWLRRRYRDFTPEPALGRACRRALGRLWGRRSAARATPPPSVPRTFEPRFLALDILLGVEELVGLTLSNRPVASGHGQGEVRSILVADRFPRREDPLVEYANALQSACIEAAARPEAPAASSGVQVTYREDDTAGGRWAALLVLSVRHPARVLRELTDRGRRPTLLELAPVARRIEREPHAALGGLGTGESQSVARRLAALIGRELARS